MSTCIFIATIAMVQGQVSTCNAGDPGDVGSIPGLERSPGGGNGNPLQYSPVFLLEKISWMEDPDKLQSI